MAAISNRDTKTPKPIYDSRGLIVGYQQLGTSTATQKPRVGGNAVSGALPGTIPVAGQVAGAVTAPQLQTAPATPQFTVTRTEKNPALSGAVDSAIQSQQQASTQLQKSFQDYLTEAREVNAQAKQQLAKDQAAFDTTRIEQRLPAINRQYQTTQDSITGDIERRNAEYEARLAETVGRLNNENRTYETAAQGVASQAVAQALRRNNLYQLNSSTPTSNSGNLTNRAIQAYIDVNTPLQRELSARRYSQISDIERGMDREVYGIDQSLLGRRSSLASDYAGRESDTERYLQSLRQQVAGMSRAQAQDYLRQLQVPIEVAQRIMGGEIANLGALQGLDERANFYTLNTPFDSSRIPNSPYFPIEGGSRRYYPDTSTSPEMLPGQPSISGTSGGAGGFVPPAARDRSSPTNLAYRQETGFWPDENFDQLRWNQIYFRLQNGRGTPSLSGVVDLPNDYAFGRTPSQQRDFLETQRSYE